MDTAIETLPMTAEEARQYVGWINSCLDDARAYLLELYERQGWRALGYDSWHACIQAEFRLSRTRVYQLLDAAHAERVLLESADTKQSTMVDCSTRRPIPERELRPLVPLAKEDPEAARMVWREAQETAQEQGMKLTAVIVEEKVEEHRRTRADARGTSGKLRDARGRRTIDPNSPHFRAKQEREARKAEILRAHHASQRTAGSLERTERALRALTTAVAGLVAQEPEAYAGQILTEYRPEAAKVAALASDWWARVATALGREER